MKQPKLILTIKQKCRYSEAYEHDNTCLECNGTGQQEIKIYALRDFEKCYTTMTHDELCLCKGTGYIIPKKYEPYEIKKVSEMRFEEEQYEECQEFYFESKQRNLKEDDKVVVRRR